MKKKEFLPVKLMANGLYLEVIYIAKDHISLGAVDLRKTHKILL